MAYYAYHRVSTKNQHEDRGAAEIEAFCKQKDITLSSDIFCDKQTGKNFNRPEYQFIRDRIQKGNTLIITEMDRLGRNKAEILKELQFFRDRGIYVIHAALEVAMADGLVGKNAAHKLRPGKKHFYYYPYSNDL